MTKRTAKKIDPAKDFGIPAAYSGDPEGVACFLMFVESALKNMSGLGIKLPPIMNARLHSLGKDAGALREYVDGYVAATKLR